MAGIAHVITPDSASGAQIIDGSLGFSGTDQKLERTPGSAGNQQTWTWSSWVKIQPDQMNSVFSVHTGASDRLHLRIGNSYAILAQNTGSWDFDIRSNAVFRDNEWYHFVCVADFTNSTQNDRAILYVNGERLTLGTNTLPSNTTTNTIVNATKAHYIGESRSGTDFEGRMSQVYLIDGQALGPEYFGYTDPLTNTWKPKKYTGTFGTNGFYLPMDGNSPIGQDKSGNGNDWTPVNFGGFNSLDKATGAKPILNTTQGGTHAGVGVFGSRENVGYAVTVGPKTGGGNAYYIDGVERPTLTGLIRGATYTFDTSDSTVSSTHPFRLSATSAHGTEYTNGVAAITGAATTITIPHDAPETLYYYCTAHSGMGSSITGITTNEKLADQYASHCVLALPLVGSSGDVSASIACTMTNKAVTTNGDAAAASDSSNFYSGSFEFDGTGDYLTLANSSNFSFGSGDFTIEAYVRWNDLSGTGSVLGVWQSSDTRRSWLLQCSGSNTLTGLLSSDGSTGGSLKQCDATGALVANKWHHCAFTRSGNNIRLFLDGKLQATTDVTGFSVYDNTNDGLTVGSFRNDGAGDPINGYIQDVRIYKGVAKYTSDFVVPSTNPDILPDTPSGVSGSSKLTKITDGAVSFDGSSDYLSLDHNSDFDMYDSIYTWDLFFYTTDLSSGTDDEGYGTLFSQCTAGSSVSYGLGFDGSGNLSFKYWNGSSTVSTTATTKIGTNKWYHVAIVKDTASATSGNTKIFLDGKLEATTAVSGTFHNSTNPLEIGADRRSGGGSYDYFQGQISNLRAVKGTALYTSNFTPPSAPLTDVTNTKLLCCQSNTFAGSAAVSPTPTAAVLNLPLSSTPFSDSSATSATITNTGSITTTSAGTNSFNITNAASLDGSSQRITTNNTNISFQNEWTVDIYFKLDSSASGYNALINSGYGSQTSNYMYIGLDDDEKPYIETSSSGSATTASDALSKNVWYHGRVTQDGSTITFYINGESVVTKTAQTTDLSSAGTFTIGSLLDNGNNANNFHGLIGPVRVINSNIGTPSPNGEATSSGTLSNSTTRNLNIFGDAVATNFNPFITDINTVRGQESGYPTLNPLDMRASTVLSNGNLTVTGAGAAWYLARSTQFITTGKYYWEYKWYGGAVTESSGYQMGLKTPTSTLTAAAEQTGSFAFQYTSIYQTAGSNNTVTVSPGSITANDCVMFAYDADAGLMWFGVNGKWNDGANPALGTNSDWTSLPTTGLAPFAGVYNTTIKIDANFGQKPFKYAPPDGFQPINAANNRPVKVISRPDQYVGVVTYTSDSSNPISIRSFNFKPDMVWGKDRDGNNNWHQFDSVRGPGSSLDSSGTGGDTDWSSYFLSFDDNGFTVAAGDHDLNRGTNKMCAWAWKAGGAPTATNTQTSGAMTANSVSVDGVLQSAYTPSGSPSTYPKKMSIGTKQGFSIVQFEGTGANATVPHGLGKPAKFMIVKNIDEGTGWGVYHDAIGTATDNYIELQSSGAAGADDTAFQDTAPTSDVFYVGSKAAVNDTDDDSIAWIWADVPGLQKFGSYTGNADSGGNGPYVELGFRPALVWFKAITGTQPWNLFDSERGKINPIEEGLLINSSDDEFTGTARVDYLSNGFKVRAPSGGNPNVATTYIYAAWAEAPSIDLFGGGANAR